MIVIRELSEIVAIHELDTEVLAASMAPVSFDAPVREPDGAQVGELLEDRSAEVPIDVATFGVLRQEIAALGMGHQKVYLGRRQRVFVNGLAVALAQFDIDLSTGWIDEAQFLWRFRVLSPPVQLRRKPSSQKNSRRSESSSEVDP